MPMAMPNGKTKEALFRRGGDVQGALNRFPAFVFRAVNFFS